MTAPVNHPPLRVYLATCAGPEGESPVIRAWQESAAQDRCGVHRLTGDPERADLILFVDLHLNPDWRLRSLLRHPLVLAHRDKTLVYDERDHPWCALPGLYCSMPSAHFDARLQRACAYYGAITFAGDPRAGIEPDLLFSFLGSRSHPIRRRLLQLTHPGAVVEDTSGFLFYDRSNPEAYDRQKAHYLETLLRSKFVLCPRGAGTGSIRLFETLAAGRVPVIISDDWVAPAGPNWEACSLRMREADIGAIPARVEAAEANYPQLAAAARAAHEDWYAQPVIFHRLVESCAELLAARATTLSNAPGRRYRELRRRQTGYRARALAGKLLRTLKLR